MLSGWLTLNIHMVNEQEMLAMVFSFLQLEYCDSTIISALEKLMKHRGCQIS